MSTALPATVYLLCFATSTTCAYLLFRSYRVSRANLLMWTSLCFTGLAINNLAVVLDLLVFPSMNLFAVRQVASLAAVSILIFGFVWESE